MDMLHASLTTLTQKNTETTPQVSKYFIILLHYVMP